MRVSSGGFSALTMIVMALVGIVALAGIGVLSAYAPEYRSGDDGRGHALSNSAIGYRGVVELMRETGDPVVLSRGPRVVSRDSLMILTPEIQTPADTLRDISNLGHSLIVLPKWATTGHPGREGWVTTVGEFPSDALVALLPEDARDGSRIVQDKGSRRLTLRVAGGGAVGQPVEVENLQTLSGPSWIPEVVDAEGRAVMVRHADRMIYVLSDPDLINTQGLKTLDGARTALALIDVARPERAGPTMIDLTLNGFQRSRSLLRLMLEPPLLGVTLVLAALAALAGFQAVARFGPARETGRKVALGKRALADNTAGLVRLARREHRMAAPYARLIRDLAVRAIGAPRNLDEERLNAFLDRVGAQVGTETPYTELAARAGRASGSGDLTSLARALYRWKQELTHGRR